MHCIFPHTTLPSHLSVSLSYSFVRCKSLTAAIERGRAPGHIQAWRKQTSHSAVHYRPRDNNDARKKSNRQPHWCERGAVDKGTTRYAGSSNLDAAIGIDRRSRLALSGEHVVKLEDIKSHLKTEPGPKTLPYTTAASEFIYGYSSVVAAIKANRRKLYKIYCNTTVQNNRADLLSIIEAHNLSSITNEVGPEYGPAMAKASSGRPHNGIILEASPLPVPPIRQLLGASIENQSFHVALDRQTAEDVVVNGEQEMFSFNSAGWRYPLVLYVDGVVDQGNLGAIARSAYFLGVDAIVTSSGKVAPWSAITIKASAGAAEAITVFKTRDTNAFIQKSSTAGWKIYASSAYDLVSNIPHPEPSDQQDDGRIVYSVMRQSKRLASDYSPVRLHPTILLLGDEAQGLNKSLLKYAHYSVGIPRVRNVEEIRMDSMNVSDAASIICYEMLRKPQQQSMCHVK